MFIVEDRKPHPLDKFSKGRTHLKELKKLGHTLAHDSNEGGARPNQKKNYLLSIARSL